MVKDYEQSSASHHITNGKADQTVRTRNVQSRYIAYEQQQNSFNFTGVLF